MMNDKVKKENLESVVNALPISIDEEVALAKKVHDDEGARLKLVDANQSLVTFLAEQYSDKGLSLDELVKIGNEELIKAAQKFDEKSGFHFISFVVWWIRKSILDAIGNPCVAENSQPESMTAVEMKEEIPVNQILNEREQTIIHECFGIGCNEMTLAEIGNQFGLTTDEVRRIREESICKLRESGKNI